MRLAAKRTKAVLATVLLIGQSLATSFWTQCPASALDVENLIKEGIKNQLPAATQHAPIKVERKAQKLEDLIQRQDIPYGFPTMIPLQGISISGLGPKAIMSLGENYFVVRSNSGLSKMSDIYKENRAAGKANYVTADCVLHPYLAYTNRIYAETIKRHLLPMTKTLLLSMLKVAVSDYKQADDTEVRTDIEANAAFFCLALKLMDPSFPIPNIGRVPQLVQADYDSVVFAKAGRSAIFDRNEDFSYFRPQGWYRTSPELITFHRVKTWISRLNYPINDVTYDSGGIKGNNFRRSVLLYRCMDMARIDGKPAYDYWVKLVKALFVLGSQVENWQEKNLYAHDYKGVFKQASSTNLHVTLTALSEPLYRTKLLLAVRKQKPLSLGSTSIFDLEDPQAEKSAVAAFRFVPDVGYPEDPFLRYAAGVYPEPRVGSSLFPVALMSLNAWGAGQAGNFMLDSSWAMDENVAKAVTEIKRWVLRRGIAGQVQPVETRLWKMLAPSWHLLPDGIQTVLRGEMWANRKMETALSAWLDSRMSIAPPHYPELKKAASSALEVNAAGSSLNAEKINSNIDSPAEEKLGEALSHLPAATAIKPPSSPAALRNAGNAGSSNSTNNNSIGAPQARSSAPQTKSSTLASQTTGTPAVQSRPANTLAKTAGSGPANTTLPVSTGSASTTAKNVKPAILRRAARGHFLDPYPDLYNKLLLDAQTLEKSLTDLGMPLDTNLKHGLDDYTRLFQRFLKIANDELSYRPLVQADLNLLANIDMVLDKIDLPVPAVLPLEAPANFASGDSSNAGKTPSGFSWALGRPGQLFIILMNKSTQEWTLARGAVYTFYEQYGNDMSEEELLQRIDQGKIQAPYWTERFDFVQADKK